MRLDELFDSVESSIHLPIVDVCASAESYEESPEFLVSVCSLYHLSRLLIPAFEVMVFERRVLLVDATETPSAVCTRVVHAQAMGLVALLKQVIDAGLDITRLWPFTGFAAFMTGHIILVSLRVHGDTRVG